MASSEGSRYCVTRRHRCCDGPAYALHRLSRASKKFGMNRDIVPSHCECDQAEERAVRERHQRRPDIATEARLIFSLARAVPVPTTQLNRTDWRGALQLAS